MNHKGEPTAIYIRVSTGYQQGSMEIQDSECIAFAEYQGLLVLPEYVFKDEAVSGTIPIYKRPGGRKMMDVLEKGKVKHLIILKMDRLGRNAMDIQHSWRLLTVNLGITIHVVKDPHLGSLSSSDMMGKFLVGFFALIAEMERDRIAERIVLALDHKIKNGEQCGSVPYGWIAVETNRINSKRNVPIKELRPHPEEQRWLIQMFQWRALGWNFPAIAKALNDQNVPTKHRDSVQNRGGRKVVVACRWSRGLVYNVMTNKRNSILAKQFSAGDSVSGAPVNDGEVKLATPAAI